MLFRDQSPDAVAKVLAVELDKRADIIWKARPSWNGHRGELINRMLNEVEDLEKVWQWILTHHVRADVKKCVKQGIQARVRWKEARAYEKRMQVFAEQRLEAHLDQIAHFEIMRTVNGFGRY